LPSGNSITSKGFENYTKPIYKLKKRVSSRDCISKRLILSTLLKLDNAIAKARI
jgi:hypothetical protein